MNATQQSSSRLNGSDRQREKGRSDAVADDRQLPRVSAAARSRRSLASRHDSTAAYSRYAVDLAEDLYDGMMPLDVCKEVAKVDATHQRKIEHDLRVQAFAHMVQGRVIPAVTAG